MTQRTFTLWKESSLFLLSFIPYPCYLFALPRSLVCTRWPCEGLLGAQQCLSLARGVCTLTSLKIPEDRFRTRVSDRLPWKDLGQTSQNKTTRKVQQHYRTHPILFPTWMYNRKRTPYTKEEGTQILNRVKNQLTLEQAERTRKRVEELNRSVQLEPKASTDTTAHPERDTQLLVHSSSSTEEREKDLQQPSWLTSQFVPFTHSCLISVRTKPWIHLIT